MSQSCFFSRISLKILSGSYLQYVGIRGIYTGVCLECKMSVFPKQSGLVTWPRDLTESRANCLAKLEVLSCSAPVGITLQLLCMLHTCASFGDLPAASQSRDPAWVHTLELFFTLSHTLPLHDSYLNTRFLNVELQANWHGIKPTKWLINFNLTKFSIPKKKCGYYISDRLIPLQEPTQSFTQGIPQGKVIGFVLKNNHCIYAEW